MRLTLHAQFRTDCINFIHLYWSHLLKNILKFKLYKYKRVKIYPNQCWIIVHWPLWEQNAVNFELWYTFSLKQNAFKSRLRNGAHFRHFSQYVNDWLLTLTICMVDIECDRSIDYNALKGPRSLNWNMSEFTMPIHHMGFLCVFELATIDEVPFAEHRFCRMQFPDLFDAYIYVEKLGKLYVTVGEAHFKLVSITVMTHSGSQSIHRTYINLKFP